MADGLASKENNQLDAGPTLRYVNMDDGVANNNNKASMSPLSKHHHHISAAAPKHVTGEKKYTTGEKKYTRKGSTASSGKSNMGHNGRATEDENIGFFDSALKWFSSLGRTK